MTDTPAAGRYAKRGPVIMPVVPPREVLWIMAGSPILLAASDEQICRDNYALLRQALANYARSKRK